MKITYLLPLLFFSLFDFSLKASAQEIKLLTNLSKELGSSEYRLMESVELEGTLYFTTWSGTGTHLWRTDGGRTALVYQWPLATLVSGDYAVNKLYVYG